jgi:hypothetical protein
MPACAASAAPCAQRLLQRPVPLTITHATLAAFSWAIIPDGSLERAGIVRSPTWRRVATATTVPGRQRGAYFEDHHYAGLLDFASLPEAGRKRIALRLASRCPTGLVIGSARFGSQAVTLAA